MAWVNTLHQQVKFMMESGQKGKGTVKGYRPMQQEKCMMADGNRIRDTAKVNGCFPQEISMKENGIKVKYKTS